MSAPAEKMAPSSSHKGSSGATQMHERSGERSERRGSETTGQAPSQSGAGSASQSSGSHQSADDMNKSKKNGNQAQDKTNKSESHRQSGTSSKSETTGQAPSGRSGIEPVGPVRHQHPEQPVRHHAEQDGFDQVRPGERAQPSGQTGERAGTSTNTTTSTNTNVSVNLSGEQRTRIHEVIVKDRSAPRVTNVNFSLSVGTAVPRYGEARTPALDRDRDRAGVARVRILPGGRPDRRGRPNNLTIVAVINA